MAGSPEASWLAVGRVRRPHGVHGEITVEILTDFPQRIADGVEVGLGHDAPEFRRTIRHVRVHKGDWLLSIADVGTRDEVEGWRGLHVFLPPQERSQLSPTYYYEHELVGRRCVRPDGSELGTVTALEDGPGGSLLTVAAPSGEVLVPFRSPIVVRVDLEAGTVVVDPPLGLFEGDAL
ncbi:MAG TPA: ribosome maturation factor RimM [Thermoanaerobaculaceae bacterium]|nr:ribosome maturation factor RimM [Thermoanaerobaculaceae bacterium]